MLTLLTHPGGFGLFSLSPFCVKAAYLLELSGEPWQREDFADLQAMPYGKLPALRDGGRIIADSDIIRRHLEARGADFDAGLSDTDKALSRVLIRFAEEDLYFHLVAGRWASDVAWPMMRSLYFAALPDPVAEQVRDMVLGNLRGQGLGRFPDKERLLRLDQDLAALEGLLGDRRFLFGDRASAADCSVAPVLAAMTCGPVDPQVTGHVTARPALTGYAARVAAAIPLAIPAGPSDAAAASA